MSPHHYHASVCLQCAEQVESAHHLTGILAGRCAGSTAKFERSEQRIHHWDHIVRTNTDKSRETDETEVLNVIQAYLRTFSTLLSTQATIYQLRKLPWPLSAESKVVAAAGWQIKFVTDVKHRPNCQQLEGWCRHASPKKQPPFLVRKRSTYL